MSSDDSHSDNELAELERGYKNGDGDACAELLSRLEDRHRRRIHRLMGFDDHATEDVFGDAKVKLLEPTTRASYDLNRPWLPWAWQILYHTALDYHRKRAGRQQVPLDDFPAPAANDDLRLDLDVCLEGLPPNLRELLIQCYLDGKEQKEIAADQSCSRALVCRNLKKACALLRDCLGDKGHGVRLR